MNEAGPKGDEDVLNIADSIDPKDDSSKTETGNNNNNENADESFDVSKDEEILGNKKSCAVSNLAKINQINLDNIDRSEPLEKQNETSNDSEDMDLSSAIGASVAKAQKNTEATPNSKFVDRRNQSR